MPDSSSLTEQVVLLTGAAGGIGSAIATQFNRYGAQMLLADLDQERVAALASTLDPEGGRVISVAYDASDPSDADTAVSTCVGHFGRIDHVVPAAAVFEHQPFATMTDAQWRRTMAINLDGVFYICRQAVPHMKSGGTIVTVASDAAHDGGSPCHANYAASKGGVLAFTRSLAKELAPDIRVNAVSPGTIETAMVKELLETSGDGFLAKTPAGRFGTAEEVANVVAFLCSGSSSYVTGEAIHVNGGAYMGG